VAPQLEATRQLSISIDRSATPRSTYQRSFSRSATMKCAGLLQTNSFSAVPGQPAGDPGRDPGVHHAFILIGVHKVSCKRVVMVDKSGGSPVERKPAMAILPGPLFSDTVAPSHGQRVRAARRRPDAHTGHACMHPPPLSPK
jgi:hypothetical protein